RLDHQPGSRPQPGQATAGRHGGAELPADLRPQRAVRRLQTVRRRQGIRLRGHRRLPEDQVDRGGAVAEGSAVTEWFLFLPQSRLGVDDIVARARTAEASGFHGVAFIDLLETPMAPDAPIWEAMTIATWVAAHTQRLRVGHLVLCDAF